jgi:hypothetical protein
VRRNHQGSLISFYALQITSTNSPVSCAFFNATGYGRLLQKAPDKRHIGFTESEIGELLYGHIGNGMIVQSTRLSAF